MDTLTKGDSEIDIKDQSQKKAVKDEQEEP